jgi:protein-L-isoaspartate(D-aspartate) O-methyltransferase
MNEEKFARQRHEMVAEQIEARHLRDPRLLDAMRRIPRHAFIPPTYHDLAYQDRPVLIGENQTISQPYIVALMTNLLQLQGEERVLEIGTGSGYQAAILAAMARQVYTIERHELLAERAAEILEKLGIKNVAIRQGDGSRGWPEEAPFDAIMVTAAAPRVPKPLSDQLAEGGRMVIPVGPAGMQQLEVWTRQSGQLKQDVIVPVSFVPLRGEFGFEDDWTTGIL